MEVQQSTPFEREFDRLDPRAQFMPRMDQHCVVLCGVPGVGRTSAALELVKDLRERNTNWIYIDSDVLFQPLWRAQLSALTEIEMDTPGFRDVSTGARVSRHEFLALCLRLGHDVVFTETVPTITDPNIGLKALQERFPTVRFQPIYMKVNGKSEDEIVSELQRRLRGRAERDPDGYGQIDRRKLSDVTYYPRILGEYENLVMNHRFETVSFSLLETPKGIAARLLKTVLLNEGPIDLSSFHFCDGGGI